MFALNSIDGGLDKMIRQRFMDGLNIAFCIFNDTAILP